MGFWGSLGKIGGAIGAIGAVPFTGGGSLAARGPILGAAGAGLGAISQGQAQNRGEKFGGQLSLEQLLMEREGQQFNQGLSREQDSRASGLDAFRRALMAQHTLEPGARPQLSPYSVAPRQANEHERIAAQAMAEEVANRLINGYQGPAVSTRPSGVDPNLLNPGGFERIAGYASPFLSALGALKTPQMVPNNSRLTAANYLQQAPRL